MIDRILSDIQADLKNVYGFAELELFQARQSLDPLWMSTGKRNSRKKQLQRRLMQAQNNQYGIRFPQI